MSRAQVESLDVLLRLRQAFAKFYEAAQDALSSAEMEVGRGVEWVQQDLPKQWRAEQRRRELDVTRAQAELDRARLAKVRGEPPSCIDEKKALAKTKRRLEAADDTLRLVKKWGQKIEDDVRDYRLPTQQLYDFLTREMPRALAELDRMHATLEAYANVPSGGPARDPSAVSSPTTVAPATGSTTEDNPPAVEEDQP